ncbi:hypothetical protein KIPB_014378, partial [Kipferlia bialata]|eukprot:g14378.t1
MATRVFLVGEMCVGVSHLVFMVQSRVGQASPYALGSLLLTILVTVTGAVWALKDYMVDSVLGMSVPVLGTVLIHTYLVWHSTVRLETHVEGQVVRLNRCIDASMGVFYSSIPSGTREYVTAPEM